MDDVEHKSLNQVAAGNIRRHRLANGLTQGDVALFLTNKTGRRWTTSKVSDIENAAARGESGRSTRERQITLDELVAIAHLLRVSFFDLLLPPAGDILTIAGAGSGRREAWTEWLFHMPGRTIPQDTVDLMAARLKIPSLHESRVILGFLPDVNPSAEWDEIPQGEAMEGLTERTNREFADFIERTNPLIWEANRTLIAGGGGGTKLSKEARIEVLETWRLIRGTVG